jgi:hypothetical protein
VPGAGSFMSIWSPQRWQRMRKSDVSAMAGF